MLCTCAVFMTEENAGPAVYPKSTTSPRCCRILEPLFCEIGRQSFDVGHIGGIDRVAKGRQVIPIVLGMPLSIVAKSVSSQQAQTIKSKNSGRRLAKRVVGELRGDLSIQAGLASLSQRHCLNRGPTHLTGTITSATISFR